MAQKIEFYNNPDGIIHFQKDGEGIKILDESCKEIIQKVLINIRDLYPSAFFALSQEYASSQRNRPYFEYKIVHRFIRCNFGEYDSLSFDIDTAGNFNFENVRCPLRGECKYEGIICMPSLQTDLSTRETEVVTLLLKGYDRLDIAEELDMSPYTVTRHFSNIRQRLGLKTTTQIITHFKNGLNKT